MRRQQGTDPVQQVNYFGEADLIARNHRANAEAFPTSYPDNEHCEYAFRALQKKAHSLPALSRPVSLHPFCRLTDTMHPICPHQNVRRPDNADGVDISIDTSGAPPRLTNRDFHSSLLLDAHSRYGNAGRDNTGSHSDGPVRFASTLSEAMQGNPADALKAPVSAPGKSDITAAKTRGAGRPSILGADETRSTAKTYNLQGSVTSMRNSENEMPLFLAAENGDLGTIKGLVASGADVEHANQDGWTPLMCAARHGHCGVVNFFLSRNASAATLNRAGWNALMIAAYYGQRKVAEAIINAEPDDQEPAILLKTLIAASDLNEPALLHAIVLAARGSSRAFDSVDAVRWAIRKNMPEGFFEALADADLSLTRAQYKSIATEYGLPTREADHLRRTMVEEKFSRLVNAALIADKNKPLEFDDYLGHPAPDAPRGNALGLTRQGIAQFANARHCTNTGGQYRHAICMMPEEAPRPELPLSIDGMLLMGWRSSIRQLINETREDAEQAAPRVATLLAGQQGRLVLTDASGSIAATNSIHFRETLFAFQLARNERLNQLAAPPNTAPDVAQETASAEAGTNAANHRLAMQFQAQALLELNKTYVPLGLRMPSPEMPSLSRTEALEAKARSGNRSDASAALAEVQALVLETEQLFERIMETEQGLVQHWFLDELTRLLDGMNLSCTRIKSSMSDA